MNIKEHIEAGHYPVDARGRSLVPTKHGQEPAIIYATDAPAGASIVGYLPGCGILRWSACGNAGPRTERNLLPPCPRKIVRYAAISRGALCNVHFYESDGPARREIATASNSDELALITMAYEVPWS